MALCISNLLLLNQSCVYFDINYVNISFFSDQNKIGSDDMGALLYAQILG